MKSKLGKYGSAWAMAAAVSVLAWAAQAQERGVVKIGVNESLSGNFVSVGLPPAASLRMAVKEINEAGGFEVGDTTYTLELVEVDNQSVTAMAVSGMTKLVEDDGVKFVFGPTLSTLATQAAEIAVPAQVIEFSAAIAWQNNVLQDPSKPLLFGVSTPSARTVAIDIEALTALGAKSVAIVSQEDDTFKAVLPALLPALEAASIEATQVLFPGNTSDFTPYASRIKAEGSDAVLYFYPQARAHEVLRAIINIGGAPKGFGGRNLDPNVALSGATGSPIPIPFFTSGNTPSLNYPPNERVARFAENIAAFEPQAMGPTSAFTFFTYDYVHMLIEAMKIAGTVDDTMKIGEALASLTYDGVAGKICFGKEVRTATTDGSLVFVRNGEIESRLVPSDCQ